jgi:hypothetical protein
MDFVCVCVFSSFYRKNVNTELKTQKEMRSSFLMVFCCHPEIKWVGMRKNNRELSSSDNRVSFREIVNKFVGWKSSEKDNCRERHPIRRMCNRVGLFHRQTWLVLLLLDGCRCRRYALRNKTRTIVRKFKGRRRQQQPQKKNEIWRWTCLVFIFCLLLLLDFV